MSSYNVPHSDRGSETPSQLFGYEVISTLGQGAGSVIYVVADPVGRQLRALKHVQRIDDKDIRFVEQLEAEFEVSRQFRHSGLRRTLDMKINRTLLRKVTNAALVMELFDGAALDVNPPSTLPGMMNVFIQTARALHALHEMGYVHCDLKPNNILIGAGGEVKIIDFGQTCRIGTVKERIQGTPDYISPEQVKCEPVTPRTDVFNLGATMYWGLTGRKIPTLFTIKRTENSFLVDSAIATPQELNPSVPEPLSNLVMDCCRTRLDKRPADMDEVARRLEVMLYAMTQRSSPAPANFAAYVA
jgi:serine/threonine-protein kinase